MHFGFSTALSGVIGTLSVSTTATKTMTTKMVAFAVWKNKM